MEDCSEVKMSFGKHKGWTLGQLPDDYLAWLVSGRCDFVEPGGWAYSAGLRGHIDREVQRRNKAADEAEDREAEETYDRNYSNRPNYPPGFNPWDMEREFTRQQNEERERQRKAAFRTEAETKVQCTRCHDTGYVSAFGMKATCNCERGLLHKVRDLEKVLQEENTKRVIAEHELMYERAQANTWRQEAQRATRTSDEGRSREDGPSVPHIRSSVTRTSCMEILTAARRGYAKSLHPDVAKGDPDKKKRNEERLMVLNASLDFLEKCAATLRNE